MIYVQASAVTAALASEAAYVYGLERLAALEPFFADDIPGSPFLQQLPTGGANRISLSVTDASGAAPWSLALSAQGAQNAMYLTTGMGVGLFWSALALYDYLDWSSSDAIWAYTYIGSAVSLANLAIGLPGHWCALVGGGVCQASDGFITTGSQAYPGGQNFTFAAAAHTKETADVGLLQQIESRLLTILGQ